VRLFACNPIYLLETRLLASVLWILTQRGSVDVLDISSRLSIVLVVGMSAPLGSPVGAGEAAAAKNPGHGQLNIEGPNHHHLLTSSKHHLVGGTNAPLEVAVTPVPDMPEPPPAPADAKAPSLPSIGSIHIDRHGGPPLPNPIEPEGRARLLRRPSMSMKESGLVHSVLQRAASTAGSATKLNLLKKTLESYSDEHGFVDFASFKEAFGGLLEIDDPVLLASYFRAMEPKVKVSTVMNKIERLTSGTVRDTITFAFAAFDEHGTGFIDRASFVHLVMSTIKGSASHDHSHHDHHDADRSLEEKLAALFDSTTHEWGADKMSKSEFEDFVLSHEGELNALREDYRGKK
jgi:Ca2+-binding EF-hand superfamily protein